ncbi:hypothetical protein GCM10007939_17800 [Amylibacter marinus]|uniref:Lipopolysaccharide export system protein LptC n=1 Tax=Amylibacter marinus TaxID=1475483 RepID=A0ABQ5VW22_9RHOB|nr:LPS export ABC transporter periplasmic protein LptC [Amylibacter marinus]GLQ35497.1 hypothetical protein GCM10007939_17800 [Amylibacter marinus]
MTARRDTYSTVVKWTKRILPLFALLLLISIFTLTKGDALRNGTLFVPPEVLNLATGQKITNPHFSGVTDAGDAYLVAADAALPDAPKPSRIDLENPRLEINTHKGLTLNSTAQSGALNIKSHSANLRGDVILETSNGYLAQGQGIEFNLKTGSATSAGKVQVEGPIGSITAGQFSVFQNTSTDARRNQGVLKFSQGVRLIYLPSERKSAK